MIKQSLITLTICLLLGTQVFAAAVKPNVVIIFIDDMGYADIGPFGAGSRGYRGGHPCNIISSRWLTVRVSFCAAPARRALKLPPRSGSATSIIFPASLRKSPASLPAPFVPGFWRQGKIAKSHKKLPISLMVILRGAGDDRAI